MPTYEFACIEHGRYDVTATIAGRNDLQHCPECSQPMRRIVAAPAVKLKGAGFYKTEYANRDAQRRQSRARMASGETHADLTD